MQIVIDIPEERFNDIQRIAQVISYRRLPALEKVIANGTPLPEGHGRIGDLSELETRIGNFIEYYKNLLEETNPTALVYMNHILDGIRDTDTIIEADKENQNDD